MSPYVRYQSKQILFIFRVIYLESLMFVYEIVKTNYVSASLGFI